jgi:nitrate/nitrite-specific signal transduction histidine kinase
MDSNNAGEQIAKGEFSLFRVGTNTRYNASGRFGLASMRERARRLGGQIAIDSELEHGTRIAASILLFPRMSTRS